MTTPHPTTSTLNVKTPEAFNISIMKLNAQRLQRVGRVTSTETYDGSKANLHPQGLYSPIIFGDIGSESRDYTFGYIKLNTKIFHPLILQYLIRMKQLNKRIIEGTAFAVFDSKLGEFVETDIEKGDTGYHFFMKHCLMMKFKTNKSTKHNRIVEILNKDRDQWFLEQHLVLPAGLRDLTVEPSGKVTEDEINEYYRKMLRLANSLETLPKTETPDLDNIRLQLQNVAGDIYLYIKSILTGKSGFLLKKWASRTVHNASRNVIGSQDPSCSVLGSGNAVTSDHVQLGIFQVMASTAAIVLNCTVQSDLIRWAFPNMSETAELVHPTTLKRVTVNVPTEMIERYTTIDGVKTQIKRFENPSIRSAPISISGHYLGLIYQDDHKYMILNDIDHLPSGWDKKYVRPITYVEFYYIHCRRRFNELLVQITRYPVTGDESIYIGELYLKTTVNGLKLREYKEGQFVEDGWCYEYPDLKHAATTYHDVATVSATRVKWMGGDSISHRGHFKLL